MRIDSPFEYSKIGFKLFVSIVSKDYPPYLSVKCRLPISSVVSEYYLAFSCSRAPYFSWYISSAFRWTWRPPRRSWFSRISTRTGSGTSTLRPCTVATSSTTSTRTYPSPRYGKPVADPGFPRGGGANSPWGGANIRFCQIFPKAAWNWKNLDPRGGAASKILLCRSATANKTTVNHLPRHLPKPVLKIRHISSVIPALVDSCKVYCLEFLGSSLVLYLLWLTRVWFHIWLF